MNERRIQMAREARVSADDPLPTFADFERAFKALSKRQRAWVCAKASRERMTRWSVMREWTVPATANLNLDGTWRTR